MIYRHFGSADGLMAAGHFGYQPHIAASDPVGITNGIPIQLTKHNNTTDNPLFYQIGKRQTNRRIYSGYKIPGSVLGQLQSICNEEHIRFHFIETGTSAAQTIL